MKHGVPWKYFVGLKAKIYTFLTEDNYESEKSKNISKNVLDD